MSNHTIVILHGWGHSRDLWAQFTALFPKGTVLAYDLPGFGSEPLVDADWGIPEYAAWVRARIEKQNLQNVVLMGHSFGGRIAAWLASENPAWLAGLVLYGTPLLRYENTTIAMCVGIAKAFKPFVPKSFTRFVNPELTEADERGMGVIYRKSVNFDERGILGKIAVPTLLVWGEGDTSAPVRTAEDASKLIPRSTVAILPDAGHSAHLENPILFYGTIKRFLEHI